jgi:hypothetical protein
LMDYWVSEHIGGDLAMEGALHIEAVRGPLTRSLSEQCTGRRPSWCSS